MLDTLSYSFQKRTCGQGAGTIVLLDSLRDWDAEKSGKEPGYDKFCSVLADVLASLVSPSNISAAFTQRGGAQVIRSAQDNHLNYGCYPRTMIERMLAKVFGISSGVCIKPSTKEEIEKIFHLSGRSNEWLFLVGNGHANIDWNSLQPAYLLDNQNQELDILSIDAQFVCYHEANLCYAEIASCRLMKDSILNALHASSLKTMLKLTSTS